MSAARPRDVIEVTGLKLRAVIGIFDFERDRRQDVTIGFKITTDTRKAASTDDIACALDYKTVTKRVIDLVEGSSDFLIEKLIERIARTILAEPLAEQVEVTLEKPGALRHASSVGITIVRTASDFPASDFPADDSTA